MEPKSPSKAKLPISPFFHKFRILKLLITIAIVILLILIGYYFVHNLELARNRSYFTVVLDCGSSGTRVNVYEWMLNRDPKSKYPILVHSFPDNSTKKDDDKDGCAYHCMQTEPGLDKFVGNASGVKGSLEPLIRRAEKWVLFDKRKHTPIFVLGTAGLRRLDKESVKGVLDDVESVVKLHEFKFRRDWIRVLSGEEEAYYGWIALNHRMGVFGNSSRLPTLGLLDLGGSSLQVATEMKQPAVSSNGIFRSKIGSFEHPIMADSLPAFGLNEAFDRTVVMLSYSQGFVERDVGSFEIRHPCLGNEFAQNYTCYGCFRGNSTTKMTKDNDYFIKIVGEPNWEKCKLLARAAAVNLSSSSEWSKLSDDSRCTGLSSVNGQFSNIFYALYWFTCFSVFYICIICRHGKMGWSSGLGNMSK